MDKSNSEDMVYDRTGNERRHGRTQEMTEGRVRKKTGQMTWDRIGERTEDMSGSRQRTGETER